MQRARLKRPVERPNFIRKWRQHRGYTLEQLADMSQMNKGNLSKLERGVYPYNQGVLEALAHALMTEPASLLMRDPTEPRAIWSLWDQAKPVEKDQIVQLAETVLAFRHRNGTDG